MLKRSSKYGILAILYLAKQDRDEYIPISEISKDIRIPFHYLTKIYQILSKKGLVTSQKGFKGGIKIAKRPSSIYISNIIEAMSTSKSFEIERYEDQDYNLSFLLDQVLNVHTTQLVDEYCKETNIENLINDIFLIQNRTK